MAIHPLTHSLARSQALIWALFYKTAIVSPPLALAFGWQSHMLLKMRLHKRHSKVQCFFFFCELRCLSLISDDFAVHHATLSSARLIFPFIIAARLLPVFLIKHAKAQHNRCTINVCPSVLWKYVTSVMVFGALAVIARFCCKSVQYLTRMPCSHEPILTLVKGTLNTTVTSWRCFTRNR